jgi:uncharacterized protein YjbI with pentapeptide repeats
MSEILAGDGAKIPQIPQTSVIDPQLRPVIEGIRGIFNVRAFGKSEVDRWVTWRDLVQNNIVVYKDGNTTYGGAGSNFFPISQDPEDFTVPPAPVNLTAASAALTVIVEWDNPLYVNLAYAEIWRSTTNDLGNAIRIGTTPSFLYADAVGAGSITYYYWVRFVSKKDVVGPYNSLLGTIASTGLIGNVDLGPLIVEASNLAADAVEEGKIKDFAVTTTKIANLAVGNAAIANGAITNAKIGNLAVDSAKIADAAIVTAKIADATITNAKIGNAEITGAKIANATIGTANITNGAITNALIGDAQITTAKIGDAQITTAKIGDAQISGAKIQNAAISTALIADAAIVTAKILDGAILNAKIGDGQITNAKIGDAQITAAKIGDAQITTAKIGSAQIDTLRIAGNAVTTQVQFQRTNFSVVNDTKSLVVASGTGGPVIINLYVKRGSQPDMFINGGYVLSGFHDPDDFANDYTIYPYFYNAPSGSFTITIYDDGTVSLGTPGLGWVVHALLTQR